MKLAFLIGLLWISSVCMAGEIVLEGIYQGKNIFVMNPFVSSGNGFCIYEVSVNGQIITDEINSSAFEIDITPFTLQIGEKISIKIKHKDDCLPKILNPEVLKPRSTFEVTSIKLDKEGKVKWVTTGEAGILTFVVEQFRWNKWINVGTIEGKGTAGPNEYSINIPLNTGDNRVRVKQIDYTKKPRLSKEAKFRLNYPEVTYSPEKPVTEINFSAETMYEIYDYSGTLISKGIGTSVNISGLKKGDYFLNYDAKTEVFRKK